MENSDVIVLYSDISALSYRSTWRYESRFDFVDLYSIKATWNQGVEPSISCGF